MRSSRTLRSVTSSAAAILLLGSATNANAQTYARAGWQAPLATFAHGTRGTVVIVDADTFRVDDFYYDGGGINVHFVVAPLNTYASLSGTGRIVTDLNLLGTPHAGDSLTIDLPTGATLDGQTAVSLWCIPAAANFASGTFAAVPEPGTLLASVVAVPFLGRRRPTSGRRRSVTAAYHR